MKELLALFAWVFLLASNVAAGEGYVIEPPPDLLSEDRVIAQYGNETVTLGELWARIRFERWLYWRALEQLVTNEGSVVLNLSDATNPYRETLQTLVNFVKNENEFAEFVWQRLTREAFYRNEAESRNLTVAPCVVLGAWAQLISWKSFRNCEDTEDFAEARSDFIATAEHFSGITESALDASIAAQILLADLRNAIREEMPPISESTSIRARQIRTDDLASSNLAMEELGTGGDFTNTMLQFGADTESYGNSGDLGFLTRGVVTVELDHALFEAGVGEWIGPIESDYGFHIARVTGVAPQIRLRHIQVSSLPEAEKLHTEILAGADFATLARLHSKDAPTARNGGEIGYLTRTQLLPELEDEIFNAQIGDLLGPIQSPYGYHLIEILDVRPRNLLAQARILVVDSPQKAERLLRDLSAGADFAAFVAEHSLHQPTLRSAGSIGYIRPDSERLPDTIMETIFKSEISDLIGPFPFQDGYALLQVTDLRDEAFALRAQHILVGSIHEAEDALNRLLNGEDFTTLAREISIDPSARGQDGDTLAFFTKGERRGSFLPGETHPKIEAAIADAEVGAVVGPIETELGHFILRIEDRTTRFLNPLEMEEALDAAVDRWLKDQHTTQMHNRSDAWRVYIPEQPLPSDISPLLRTIDDELQEAE